jgi:hypothetical protein
MNLKNQKVVLLKRQNSPKSLAADHKHGRICYKMWCNATDLQTSLYGNNKKCSNSNGSPQDNLNMWLQYPDSVVYEVLWHTTVDIQREKCIDTLHAKSCIYIHITCQIM